MTEALLKKNLPQLTARAVGRRLLGWYDRGHRDLPWRELPGKRATPYEVWLSEIMLQQTTVAAVIPYFERFCARWPNIGALAAADLDEVLAEWQGLGYYARARNLAKCAREVATNLDGRFPDTVEGLLALPGIGPYTAAAIAAIAFDRHAVVVDGNVERVIARLFAVTDPLPAAKGRLTALAGRLTPKSRPGDYAQAMMDLGATVCKPQSPDCGACPLALLCAGRAAGIAAELPRRSAKPPRPVRRGTAWVVVNATGAVLLRRRPENGLLGGMMEVPSSPWCEAGPARARPPVTARWRDAGDVGHVFTHFRLELAVRVARIPSAAGESFGADARWVARDGLGEVALPTVMKKVCRAGFAALDQAPDGTG